MPRRYEAKKPWAGLYRTATWQRLRETKLTEEPFCRFCRKAGKDIPAEVVDHIKAHKGDEGLFYDFDNLQSLCKPCHDGAKQAMERGSIVIHYGPDGFPLPIGG